MELFNEIQQKQIKAFEVLKNVIDPELGINIIDMGLVYNIEYSNDKGFKITMTLSSPGCPMGDIIRNDIEREMNEHFENAPVDIELTWEPRWTTDYITPRGRAELNELRG